MSLNIKNQRVHDLAREAAARSGLSQTGAIERALEAYLDSLSESSTSTTDRIAALEAIGVEFRRGLSDEERARLTTDWLYDENGLPA